MSDFQHGDDQTALLFEHQATCLCLRPASRNNGECFLVYSFQLLAHLIGEQYTIRSVCFMLLPWVVLNKPSSPNLALSPNPSPPLPKWEGPGNNASPNPGNGARSQVQVSWCMFLTFGRTSLDILGYPVAVTYIVHILVKLNFNNELIITFKNTKENRKPLPCWCSRR